MDLLCKILRHLTVGDRVAGKCQRALYLTQTQRLGQFRSNLAQPQGVLFWNRLTDMA